MQCSARLSYARLEHDVVVNLTDLRVQSLADHGQENEYGSLSPSDVSCFKDDIYRYLGYGAVAVTLNYQDRPAGYILYRVGNNILTVDNLFTREKDRMDYPPCPYGFGQSLLHKTILDHPHTQEIKLQSSAYGWEFYKKMGFEMYNPADKYEMTMPRQHIEMWLDTPLYDKRPQFTPD